MLARLVRGVRSTWGEGVLRTFGTGGLGLWHMRPAACRRREDRQEKCGGCRKRHRRLLRVLAVLVGLQVVGLLGLAAFGLGAPTCQPPAKLSVSQAASYTRSGASPAVFARQVLTAGQTGLALTYAKTRGADVCRFAPNGNLVARMESGFARGGTMYGHVFLTYTHVDYSYRELRSIKRHETRHTTQWAAGTFLAGPLAFPVAYSADELIAPGAYNHFERAAGLTEGGYEVPDGPSPTLTRVFIAAVLVGLVLFERHRFRRQLLLLRTHFRHRRASRTTGQAPWWHAETKPIARGRILRLLHRVSPRTADVVAEHRRLQQVGCPSCGATPSMKRPADAGAPAGRL